MRYSNDGASMSKMKAYSIDLREKIVQAYEQGNISVRKVAYNFGVAKSFGCDSFGNTVYNTRVTFKKSFREVLLAKKR